MEAQLVTGATQDMRIFSGSALAAPAKSSALMQADATILPCIVFLPGV
jgi:hypothetical protein